MTIASEINREVLFQKLGHTWYIFTEVNNEVVYSAMPDGMDPRSTKLELFEVIEDHMKKAKKDYFPMKASPPFDNNKGRHILNFQLQQLNQNEVDYY